MTRRIDTTGQDNWQPRNPSGRYDRDRFERPKGEPSLLAGVAIIWAVLLVIAAAAIMLGPIFEPVRADFGPDEVPTLEGEGDGQSYNR